MNMSFYEWLEKQTFSERVAFKSQLRDKGVSKQQMWLWFNKRNSVPDKYHEMINQIAGTELSFPKVKLLPVIDA